VLPILTIWAWRVGIPVAGSGRLGLLLAVVVYMVELRLQMFSVKKKLKLVFRSIDGRCHDNRTLCTVVAGRRWLVAQPDGLMAGFARRLVLFQMYRHIGDRWRMTRPSSSVATCVIDRPTYRCGRVWEAASVNRAISAALSTRQTTTNTLQPVNADNIAGRYGRLSISATSGLLLGAGVASIWW